MLKQRERQENSGGIFISLKKGFAKEDKGDTAAKKRSYDIFCGVCRGAALAAVSFFLTDVHIGYALSPFSASLIASLPPLGAAAAFVGMAAALGAGDSFISCLAEFSAGAVMLVFRIIFGKNVSPKISAAAAFAAYILSAAAVTLGYDSPPDMLLIFALALRAVLCGGGAYFFSVTREFAEKSDSLRDDRSKCLLSMGAVYIIVISALCSKTVGIFCMGRIIAAFCTAAAARKYGVKGGCIMGTVSGAAFVLADSGYARCAAMLSVGGAVAGMCSAKGKHSVNVAFICGSFGIAAAAGLPSGAAEFVADMGVAAIIYCFVPEHIYLPFVNDLFGAAPRIHSHSRDKLEFSADLLEDMGNDICSVSQLLAACRSKDEPVSIGSGKILDSFNEQLGASCCLLKSISAEALETDEELSRRAEKALTRFLEADCTVTVMTDSEGRAYAEAFTQKAAKLSPSRLLDITSQLSDIVGYELELPVSLSAGEGKISRLRWSPAAKYVAECSVIGCSAENGVCGDSCIHFEDGRGNYYVILSDGMGRGNRAAAQSCTAVNILRRLILCGGDIAGAVKYLGVMLSAAADDEVFTTLDILRVNCLSGEAQLVKYGAAPTYIRSVNDEGIWETQTCEICAPPVGILTYEELSGGTEELPCFNFTLCHNSAVIMVSDGITADCGQYICEVAENGRLTPDTAAEKIIAYSDELENKDEKRMSQRDDKTAAVLRLYNSRLMSPASSGGGAYGLSVGDPVTH